MESKVPPISFEKDRQVDPYEEALEFLGANPEIDEIDDEIDTYREIRGFRQYSEQTTRYPLLRREEEVSIGRSVQSDDLQARQQLIVSNLRLVAKLARESLYRGRGLENEDLVQQGNIGLIRAAEKWDPERGYRFPTYAEHLIRGKMQRGVHDTGKTIRIPHESMKKLDAIPIEERNLTQELGRYPKDSEIAAALDMSLEAFQELRAIARPPESLDAELHDSEEGETSLSEIVTDKNQLETADTVIAEELAKIFSMKVDSAFGELNERSRFIIEERYGLTDGVPKTLHQLGQELGLTREGVRQLQARAEAKTFATLKFRLEKEGINHSVASEISDFIMLGQDQDNES